MLNISTHNRGGPLGSEGKVTIPLVAEFVHLLTDNIGVLAYATEYLDVLKERGLNQPKAKDPSASCKARNNICPSPRLWGKDIMDPNRGAKCWIRRHGGDATGGRLLR